jgi:hypothetical protein
MARMKNKIRFLVDDFRCQSTKKVPKPRVSGVKGRKKGRVVSQLIPIIPKKCILRYNHQRKVSQA